MEQFYGFEYWGGPRTTTGDPHPLTGRMSIAGDLSVFRAREDRERWLQSGSRERITVSKAQARMLHLGWSVSDFEYHLECMAALTA